MDIVKVALFAALCKYEVSVAALNENVFYISLKELLVNLHHFQSVCFFCALSQGNKESERDKTVRNKYLVPQNAIIIASGHYTCR